MARIRKKHSIDLKLLFFTSIFHFRRSESNLWLFSGMTIVEIDLKIQNDKKIQRRRVQKNDEENTKPMQRKICFRNLINVLAITIGNERTTIEISHFILFKLISLLGVFRIRGNPTQSRATHFVFVCIFIFFRCSEILIQHNEKLLNPDNEIFVAAVICVCRWMNDYRANRFQSRIRARKQAKGRKRKRGEQTKHFDFVWFLSSRWKNRFSRFFFRWLLHCSFVRRTLHFSFLSVLVLLPPSLFLFSLFSLGKVLDAIWFHFRFWGRKTAG